MYKKPRPKQLIQIWLDTGADISIPKEQWEPKMLFYVPHIHFTPLGSQCLIWFCDNLASITGKRTVSQRQYSLVEKGRELLRIILVQCRNPGMWWDITNKFINSSSLGISTQADCSSRNIKLTEGGDMLIFLCITRKYACEKNRTRVCLNWDTLLRRAWQLTCPNTKARNPVFHLGYSPSTTD